jgi:amino acid transporter
LTERLKLLFIGAARSYREPGMFHKLSLVAFFAWVGLGADGLSSSCYGPQEAFGVLHQHPSLAIFVALATAVTVFVITTGYNQVIEAFPSGGGGYLVASKLLSPTLGMVSGCALLVDYVLTITISIASGADALFSLLPAAWHQYRIGLALVGVIALTVLNSRGVRESVLPLVPIFLTFVLTHVFAVAYTVVTHVPQLPVVAQRTSADIQSVTAEVGFAGLVLLLLRSYSMGAGTYTGIEAVSNSLPILREPRVQTAKRTMRYMAVSLAFVATGLIIAYLLYEVQVVPGRTLNAVLFERMTSAWQPTPAYIFVLVTLISEAAILFVGAQTGFLGGPRVLANMALDRWVPTRFAMLSDRLVTQDGILLMGGAAAALMLTTKARVSFLVVLYSINVFITFALSQLGMVRYWWRARTQVPNWRSKLSINGVGLVLTCVILVSVTVMKFHEGGWITLFITGALCTAVVLVKRHYTHTAELLRSLDDRLLPTIASESERIVDIPRNPEESIGFDPKEQTAVILVDGYNWKGIHTLAAVIRLFGGAFRTFMFVQVGVVDAGTFKGAEEVARLEAHVRGELDRYVNLVRRQGYYGEALPLFGTDIVDEIVKAAPHVFERFPRATFFGGRIVFPKVSFFSRWLHDNIAFALHRRLYLRGIPFVILPLRV